VRMVSCASPDYLERNGTPKHPEELLKHSIITSSAGNNAVDWRFHQLKYSWSQRIQPRLSVTTNDAAIEASVQGLGITRLLSYQVATKIAEGKLQSILEDYEPPPRPIHIVHREGRYSSTRVRTFIDLLAKRLRTDQTIN